MTRRQATPRPAAPSGSRRAPSGPASPLAEPAAATTAALGSARHVLYRLWNGVLPGKVCDAVIEEFPEDEFSEAEVQRADGSTGVEPTIRVSHQLFIETAHWTGSFVTHFAEQANLLWNLDVVGLGTLSILRYAEGGYFKWHVDALSYDQTSYGHLAGHGVLQRKLGITINLSDPADYDGGALEFMNGTGQIYTQPELRDRGSVIVFPSTVGHRVTPLTRGTRYVLVGWMVGPPIR